MAEDVDLWTAMSGGQLNWYVPNILCIVANQGMKFQPIDMIRGKAVHINTLLLCSCDFTVGMPEI